MSMKIAAENLKTLVDILKVLDVTDAQIKNDIMCITNNAKTAIYYFKFPFTFSENFIITDVKQKIQAFKILTDNFKKALYYDINDSECIFESEDKKLRFESRIPILANEFVLDEFNELKTKDMQEIANLTIDVSELAKIYKLATVFKSAPRLKLDDKFARFYILSSDGNNEVQFDITGYNGEVKGTLDIDPMVFVLPFKTLQIAVKFDDNVYHLFSEGVLENDIHVCIHNTASLNEFGEIFDEQLEELSLEDL